MKLALRKRDVIGQVEQGQGKNRVTQGATFIEPASSGKSRLVMEEAPQREEAARLVTVSPQAKPSVDTF